MSEKLGPFTCDLTQGERVTRDDNCEMYNSRCLKIACDNGWPSFTCEGCERISSSARLIHLHLESAACLEHVSLHVFLARVQNEFIRRGYTPDNFLRKIQKDVSEYYGKESSELKYVTIQLKMLSSVLNEEEIVDYVKLVEESQKLIVGMRTPPSLLDMYLKICGASW